MSVSQHSAHLNYGMDVYRQRGHGVPTLYRPLPWFHKWPLRAAVKAMGKLICRYQTHVEPTET